MKLIMNRMQQLARDQNGQSAVEAFLIVAGIVLVLAAALHGFLPYLANGFMEMAKAIAGPTP